METRKDKSSSSSSSCSRLIKRIIRAVIYRFLYAERGKYISNIIRASKSEAVRRWNLFPCSSRRQWIQQDGPPWKVLRGAMGRDVKGAFNIPKNLETCYLMKEI